MKKLLLSFTILISFTALAQPPAYVPANGLVGWWPFNANANDESGNGNNGTVNGATLTTDRFGNSNAAYSFDGIDDIISLSSSANFNFSNGLGLSFWININSLPATGEAIVFSQQTSSSNTAVGFNISISASGALNFRLGNGSSATFSAVLNNSINLNQWYHVVCQYQNGVQGVYFNSQLTNSSNQPNAVVGSPGIPMLIGDDTWGGSTASNYSGKVDDIAIWNRALSECEISDLYNSQLGSLNTTATQTVTALDTYTWPINSQTYTQSGTYTAVIPNAAGCDRTITLDLSLDFTGLEENSQGALFSVFPNPAQSIINVKADNKLIGDVYTIYDNTGRVVLKGKLNTENTIIELGNLSGGIYMFSVGENMKQTFKVIKE